MWPAALHTAATQRPAQRQQPLPFPSSCCGGSAPAPAHFTHCIPKASQEGSACVRGWWQRHGTAPECGRPPAFALDLAFESCSLPFPATPNSVSGSASATDEPSSSGDSLRAASAVSAGPSTAVEQAAQVGRLWGTDGVTRAISSCLALHSCPDTVSQRPVGCRGLCSNTTPRPSVQGGKQAKKSSRFLGVYWDNPTGKWLPRIDKTIHGKTRSYCGNVHTDEEAAARQADE